jgi:hypothetical protein
MNTQHTNPDYAPYGRYPNWQLWNISLWINNTEFLYFRAVKLVEQYGPRKAAEILSAELRGKETPDGTPYTEITLIYVLTEIYGEVSE